MFKHLASQDITIPLLLFVLYLTGFVSLNTHLQTYGLFEASALSFNYVKAGTLFFIYNSVLILVAYLAKQEQQLPDAMALVLGSVVLGTVSIGSLLYWYDTLFLTAAPLDLQGQQPSVAWSLLAANVGLIASGAYLSGGAKLTKADIGRVVFMMICLASIVYLLWRFTDGVMGLLLYNALGAGAFWLLFADVDALDEILQSVPVAAVVLLLLSLAFGKLIYPRVSVAMGGGKPYLTQLYLTKAERDNLVQSQVLKSDSMLMRPVLLLYQSDKTVFVRLDGKVVGVATDGIKAYGLPK